MECTERSISHVSDLVFLDFVRSAVDADRGALPVYAHQTLVWRHHSRKTWQKEGHTHGLGGGSCLRGQLVSDPGDENYRFFLSIILFLLFQRLLVTHQYY